MKLNYLAVVLLLLCACHKEEMNPPGWGINYSDKDHEAFALGSIDNQNNGSKVTYVVDGSRLQLIPDRNWNRLLFHFTSNDSLALIINKKTNDYNYHYPKPDSENQLLYVIFNRDTLALSESAISIQPQTNDNTFTTVSNVHTLHAGDFNGTVSKVPYLR